MEDAKPEELRDRLAQAEYALERSERMALASRFASVIMHEVNNPLEAITNLVYLTKLQKDDPDQVFENMTTIEDQLSTLARVTHQALTYHRDQSEARDFDLADIATSALKLHADKLARHGVSVERRFRGPALARVQGSEILQVLSNLILNAVDALPRGKGCLTVGVKSCGGHSMVTIHDNGPGIPEGSASRLFQAYVTSKPTGTGLGLWLSRRLIHKHNGTLNFRTSRRQGHSGTMFRVCLPAAA